MEGGFPLAQSAADFVAAVLWAVCAESGEDFECEVGGVCEAAGLVVVDGVG